ncbi:FKBP-type peptidyl-prolyl cis-trans isomerase [Hyphococcus flavus]|uniref:peptidylprolyl isomerase n=1 Tax=Hyphococcus flavus TaxID=1866326 RepID=A0AAE9ZCJ3_9PROT|nr:FKBP-type peptidyl-prolyl cis-trans isomerase [Hyphococcus flavus]WDI30063.1 FKBP-type peptidyl-prolyl cis-trans isomerase [Hyphococcus flavus]
MRLLLKTTAIAAAVLMIAACDRPDPGEPEDQPEPPTDINPTDPDGDLPDEAKSGAELAADFQKLATENLAASMAFLDQNAQREGVEVTDSGLQYMVLEEGPEDGRSPVSTDLVTVHYVGTLKDGVEFDSSRARGAAAQFPLNQVIPGWTEGVQLMSEGDRYRFFVPPSLAYGENPRPGGAIGPNDALIFDVELIKVKNPEINLEEANAFLAENAGKDGIQTTESGLQYQVLTEGPSDGKSPEATDTVEVHYQGTLLNGTEFDSSYSRGQTIEFPLNRVIAGWTEGVQLMSEGDKFRFFIPPALAYGETGTPGGPIGPNEALIFEVELVAVK